MLIGDDEFLCDGCDRVHNLNSLGGYRLLCDTCVDAMPRIPKGTGKGYELHGKYPDFKWVEV